LILVLTVCESVFELFNAAAEIRQNQLVH